jgi:hypothetical protein
MKGDKGDTGEHGIQGMKGNKGDTAGLDGVSPDAPGWIATLAYTNNTQADVGFEVENLGESGSI